MKKIGRLFGLAAVAAAFLVGGIGRHGPSSSAIDRPSHKDQVYELRMKG